MTLSARLFDPPGWDWGSVPEWLTTLAAAVATFQIVRQLWGLRADRKVAERDRNRADETLKAQTKQLRLQTEQVSSEAASARANLLLRIDEHYEGAALRPSREYWLKLRTRFRQDHSLLDGLKPARDAYVHARIVKYLNDLWDRLLEGDEASRDKYYLITDLPNWWETIGMLAKERLVPLTDVKRLYRAVILETMSAMCEHRKHRCLSNPGSTAFENAVWLHDEVRTP